MRRALLATAIAYAGCFYGIADLERAGTGGDASIGGGTGGGGATGGSGGTPWLDASPDADGGCPPLSKPCGAACAPLDDPSLGCADPSCAPCAVGNATAGCTQGACSIVDCPSGLGNCDANVANGCETDLSAAGNHCGACDHDCLGGACTASKCQAFVLVSVADDPNLVAPWGIASDGNHVFFTVTNYSGTGSLMRVATDGSGLTVLAPSQAEPFDVVLDATHVYWTDNLSSGGKVAKMPKLGGSEVVLASSQNRPVGLSIDDDRVYFAAYGSHAVRSVGKGGAGLTDLATGQTGARHTAVDSGTSGSVYFTTSGDGAVRRVAKTGGAVASVSATVDSPWVVVADPTGSELFFTRFAPGGDVHRIAKTAQGATPGVVAASQSSPMYVHADATHVYFGSHVSSGSVARVPKSGGAVETLGSGLNKPVGITTDANAIYWAEYDASRIWKLAK
jgi:hypothetical protein